MPDTGGSPGERVDEPSAERRRLIALSIAALGAVFGDIGTSPLYALRLCFTGEHSVARTPENVLGILSLIFWSLALVVSVKYLSFILRADNRGEGGVLALLALLMRDERPGRPALRTAYVFVGLFGAALLYGDGMITPAISVLGAIEGLAVTRHGLASAVLPITCAILIALFFVQRHATTKLAAVFGPVMVLWFGTLAAIGLPWIARRPEVLLAVHPGHAVRFFAINHLHGFVVLGAVVLCVTGGEALYANMGHFGARPIRISWYAVVLPTLLVNYFGQGALLLERGVAVQHTFFDLVSGWAVYPLIGVATVAAVVASQTLISGAFSITQQAAQLGYFPRVTIVHTSGREEGLIYVPEVNWLLMLGSVGLVLGFGASFQLASAYGFAVTGTMTITSLLFYEVAVRRWEWRRASAGLLVLAFLLVDLVFFGANVVKIDHGGWVPLSIGVAVFTVMATWKRGRAALAEYMQSVMLPLDLFLQDVAETKPKRVQGTAVFMTSNIGGAPPVLLHHFKHNKVLHQQVVFLSIQTSREPEVPHDQRVAVRDLGQGFFQVVATYGFMQTPDVLETLESCEEHGVKISRNDLTFFLGRETLLTTGPSKMAGWRKGLFAFLSRNARPATHFFNIPPGLVVELGIHVEL
ncbi:MAG: potassium transporter Kup [Deltaproteobacteria bacterium]|nr:potassium transporter Kup [Deltaproteobacteria bacterium]